MITGRLGADETVDVIVVGAGHNGLICAAYVAAAGLEVLVLEAAEAIGGNTVSESITMPGWIHDTCSSAHVVIQSNPVIRDDELGLLGTYGLQYIHPDPAFVMPVKDDALIFSRAVEATAAQFARWSANDARALEAMMTEWDAGLARAHARWSAGLPPGDAIADRHYQDLRSRTAWDVVHSTFEHPVTRAVMQWLAFATIQPPQRPGTGALPAAVTSGRLRYGWATPVGGSGALASALARHIADHGGVVVTSASVARIITRDGRAIGVETVDGRRFRASRAVVSSAHLARLPGMLDCPAPDDLRSAAETWRPGLALFAVHLALRADVEYDAAGGSIRSTAGALGSPAGLRRQVEKALAGRVEEQDPWLLIVSSTVADPDRAPGGGGTLKLLTAAPSHRENGARWDREATEGYAESLVKLAAERVRGLDGSDVLALVAESPDDLARRNPSNLGGSCHGGEYVAANGVVPGWSDYRTGVKGLYVTGSTTHPGGSVSGRPGRNAARCLLEDLGIDPAHVMSSP